MGTPIKPFDIFTDVDTSKGYTAILSVAEEDKPVVPKFVQQLYTQGFKHFRGSAGTMRLVEQTFRDAGSGDLIDSGEITIKLVGEVILNHLIATLYPPTHAGCLALPSQQKEMEGLGFDYYQLAFVSFYKLQQTIEASGLWEDVAGDIDMGGPALAGSGAKGQRVIIVDPPDCNEVVNWLENGRPDAFNFMEGLRAKAYFEISKYRFLSAKFHGGNKYFGLFGEKVADLKYGENPQQQPAFHYMTHDEPFAIHNLIEVDSKQGSWVNVKDIDGAQESLLRLMVTHPFHHLPAPKCGGSVVKHANPCGGAVGSNPVEVALATLEGDPIAAFGGVFAFNFEVNYDVAIAIRTHLWEDSDTMRPIDGVIAPSFTDEALDVLRRKGNRGRLLVNPQLANITLENFQRVGSQFCQVRGGVLEQPPAPLFNLFYKEVEMIGPRPTSNQIGNALVAIPICATSKSNTITVALDGMVISNGVGQQDRLWAVKQALLKAAERGHDVSGATVVSDSYFPFPDGLEALIEAGVSFVVATNGSIRDEEVAAIVKDRIAFWRVPDKLFRMFYGHY